MSWFSGLRHRLHEALRPGRADRDLDEELRDHLAREVARQSADDVPAGEALRRAVLRVGGLQAAKEAVRDERTGHVLRDLVTDLRMSARMARRNPGFTATIVVSLALGVGGTTAVFSVVNAVLVRPLPYPDHDRLFMTRVWWNSFSASLSPADLLALQEQSAGIASVGAYFVPEDDAFTMATPDGPVLVTGAVITADLPQVLGVRPILGAGFSLTSTGTSTGPDAREALIGETLWRDRYGGAPDVIGRSIRLEDTAFTIAGVMPVGFNVPGQRNGAVWQRAIVRQPTRRGPFYLHSISRLAPGVTADAAASKLTAAVAPVLRDKYAVKPTWRFGLRTLRETLVGDVRRTLLLLFGAMTLVLLIAIVNVMNLFLARGTVRAHELAVRASLGAGRGRLARQLLAESALLGAVGGAAGLGLAWTLLQVGGASATLAVPRLLDVRVDAALVFFALACGVGAGLAAGTWPALRLPWSQLLNVLRDGGRGGSAGSLHGRTRQALVIAEIALTVMVLSGAVLLTKSLLRLQAIDPGFRPDGIVTFRLSLPGESYNEDRVALFAGSLESRLREEPGVSSVAFALSLPPDLLVMSNNYTVEGPRESPGKGGVAEWNVVSHDYFSVMSIGVLRGRAFTGNDRASSPRVAIVNEAFVRRHYPDGQALGRRLKSGDWDSTGPWTTIVGIASDVPYGKGLWGGADPTVYVSYAQNLWMQSPYVIVKSDGDASRLLPALREAVKAVDPNLPIRDPATMNERLRRSTTEPRLRSLLFALIAGLGLALAVTGIYGVMAYHVNQRRRETAIRRALGAQASRVVGGVVLTGLTLVGSGISIGMVGALLLSHSLATLLFRVDPRDPVSLVTVAALLATAALVACAVPAVRTARIDPASVLRDQ
jgi:putative ABC transport system permease protein